MNRIVKVWISAFFDMVFPPRCVICGKLGEKELCNECLKEVKYMGTSICQICGKPRGLCKECLNDRPAFDAARSITIYDGVIKDLIHKLKFEEQKPIAKYLAAIIINKIDRTDLPINNIDLIIPIPLSKRRLKTRGFNQSELIATIISEKFKIQLDLLTLKKIKNITPQSDLPRLERFQNIIGAFRSEDVINKTIMLFDDIYTTGATAREASKELMKSGAKKVYVLTLARSVES